VAAKVRKINGAWWIIVHAQGRRRKRRIGASAGDKRRAERIADQLTRDLAAGRFKFEGEEARDDAPKALPCDSELRKWIAAYASTLKPSTETESHRIIEKQLVPFFGSRDLHELRESDLLEFVKAKLEAGHAAKTIRNSLSVLRRVLNLLYREGLIDRNPASRLGELMNRVARSTATEANTIDSWAPEEVGKLLKVAKEQEHRLHPALATLLYTGLRRGELLGLRWEDVDLERGRIHVRRAYVKGHLTAPKSGRGRYVAMAPPLASLLIDVLADRRRESLSQGWPEVPEWVFPNQGGGLWDQDNFERSWRRVRRKAQKEGVRPLRLHCTRHTWASLALASGKSVRWVAEQLGHADPALTLRVYAHVIPDEEPDLSFLSFGSDGGPRRPYTALQPEAGDEDENALTATGRGASGILARPARLERATFRSAT